MNIELDIFTNVGNIIFVQRCFMIFWHLFFCSTGRRTVYDKEFNKVELAISATVPSDSGIYQCVAVNAAGEVSAAGRLQVNTSRNSPAAPTSLKCEARSPVKIFISWEPPKFLPFTNIAYTVHYRPVGELMKNKNAKRNMSIK